MAIQISQVLEELRKLPKKGGGVVYVTKLGPLIKTLRPNQELARELWSTGDISCRELAVRIADPDRTSSLELDSWLLDLDCWNITDSFCGDLVRESPFAVEKALAWVHREREFERRAGFALIAQMAWSKNSHNDEFFLGCLPLVEQYATDGRFYVKKGVNWALRDIAKRNFQLNRYAREMALKLQQSADPTARWIGKHRSHEIFTSWAGERP